MTFTHLQIRSGYSFYNSTITIDKLINKAKQLHIKTLTLTDEGVLHGAVSFYKKCKQNGIHPIIGLTIPFSAAQHITIPIVLLAKNNAGYRGLISISTELKLNGHYNKDLIETYAADLICVIPSDTAEIKEKLLATNFDLLHEYVSELAGMFLKNNLYFGVEVYQAYHKQTILDASRSYQEFSGMEMVALQNVGYLDETDISSYSCLQAMKHGNKWDHLSINNQMQYHHFRTEKEMEDIFHDWPELLGNITKITNACHVTLDFDKQLLPAFPVPADMTAHAYLTGLCEKQLPIKYNTRSNEAMERLQYELGVIEQLGFSDYFLIVSDFVQFAKDNQIVVGPGRGSAAGSLVAYLLGITNVDPLRFGLLFERFLNPERVTMPDIDIDFSDVRREEIIDYVRQKYGETHVAQIITFGTFLARSLLRELMKTMDIDYRDQAYILQHVPVQSSDGLLAIIKSSKAFSDYIKQSEKLKALFTAALKLEGLPRHMSTHAAGIVIGKQPLTEDVPLIKGSHDTFLTQYAMNELEAIGLLKIDILGLRNLSLMERIVKSITHHQKLDIQPDNLPENDQKTFTLLQNGKTNGIFQLESQGMKQVLMKLKPTSLDDIIAVNALYRPGPMEQIPSYIKRKHGKEKVTYLHPNLEPILNSTYGVLIYQEQIMQIAHQFAGLSLGEADILRRAISKKNRKLIEEQKENFINGCVEQGYERPIGEEIFSWVYNFANYGFNKSHSVAYSMIAYQLSYLKAHYPTYFFAHLLGTAMNDSNKLHLYIREANELGIQILPPSINKSYAYFTVENAGIRIGLMAIKGIGYETVKEIMEKRKSSSFKDVFDFCLRAKIKRNNLETLIMAGAFDETYPNRASLLATLDQAYARAELFGDMTGEGDLFTDEIKMRPDYTNIEDFSVMQKLSDEKELMQMYVSNHPMQQFRKHLAIQQYKTLQEVSRMNEGVKVKLIVILEQCKKIHTKRGDSMAFITMADETNEMEGVIFPALYREINPHLKEEAIVNIEGKISIRDQKKQLIIDSLAHCNLEDIANRIPGFIYIRIVRGKNQPDVLSFLEKAVKKYPGDTGFILYNELEKKTYKLGRKYNIYNRQESMLELKEYFGSENVVFTV